MAKIVSVEPKEKYFAVKIEDNGKVQDYKMWNNNVHCGNLRPNSEIEITGAENGKWGLCLNSFAVIKEGRLGLNQAQTDGYMALINNALHEIWKKEDENISSMASGIALLITEHEELFKTAPAAYKHHHNYIGGLLMHTVEVMTEVSDNDLLTLAAILHDFGKIFEYSINIETGVITYNEEFKKELGLDGSKIAPHLMYAYNWCIERGFKELAHLVASHHSEPEWGSIFKPSTKEAHTLFIADYKSSHLGAITVDLLEEEKESICQ